MPDLHALLAAMTLTEKIGQLNMYTDFADLTGPEAAAMDLDERREHIRTGRVGSMLNVVGAAATRELQDLALESRLKIPLVFGLDVVHGFRTQFPIPLADAAMWDADRSREGARWAAREASAAGIAWTFAPNVDVAPDQRWGRVMEGAGECPYLGSVLAKARTEGFQGEDLSAPDTIAACAKHLAGYGYAEAGREYNTVRIDDYTLHNEVLPPFRAAVGAGVATVMNGFHLLNGQPVTASRYLQREWLKDGLGFAGAVVSDWNSIGEMEPHGITADRAEASVIALKAGCDIDMEASGYVRYLEAAVASGEVDVALIDDAVLRVLRLKERLGLFDDPYRYCDEVREASFGGDEALGAASRDAAAASCVLLKNEAPFGKTRPLLPLDPGRRLKIAVIGELAAETDSPLGSWRVTAVPGSAVSLLQGVAAALGYGEKSATTALAPTRTTGDQRTVTPASTSTSFDPARLERGAAACDLRYARGPALLRAGSDRSFVKRMYLNEDDESGLAEAVALAAWADLVVLGVGEHGFMSGEARSRTDIGLPRLQQVLAKAVLSANANTVAVLYHGRALAIPDLAEACPAILCAWQPGTQGGHGIADVLFGRREPTGRLPVSFPYVVGQCPLTYRRFATGRPVELPQNSVWWSHYEDAPNEALYPFGFGLGYTTFELRDVRLCSGASSIPAKRMTAAETVTLAATVENVGERTGATVVQLYLRDPAARRARPLRELRAFARVDAAAGATAEVTLEITAATLAYWTPEEDWHAEEGEYELYVGFDSKTAGLVGRLRLDG